MNLEPRDSLISIPKQKKITIISDKENYTLNMKLDQILDSLAGLSKLEIPTNGNFDENEKYLKQKYIL